MGRNLPEVATAPKYLVYALVDPRSGQWRYIGKSARGLARPREHVRPRYLTGNPQKVGWIKELLAANLEPDIEILEYFGSVQPLSGAEREWIAAARRLGIPLTNATDGGDGTSGGGWKWSEASRAKFSASKRGVRPSAETRARMSLARRGRRPSDETRRRLSLAKSARPISLVERGSLSRAHGGRPFRDENGNVYQSYSDAAQRLGIGLFGARDVLKGRRKSCRGHIFEYCEVA